MSIVVDVVSWNLNGLDTEALGARWEAALQDILLGARIEAIAAGAASRAPPHVLLLQEVTTVGFHAHLKPHLRAAGYRFFPESPPDRNYWELIAFRAPLVWLEGRSEPLWKTQFGRWMHTARLSFDPTPEASAALPQRELRVSTAHFDSGPEPGAALARKAQARDICGTLEGPALFAGDTNLRDREWAEVEKGLEEVTDVWAAAGSDPDARFTWFGHQKKARFDRAWCGPGLVVRDFSLVGREPVGGLNAPPSDHLGLRISLTWADAPEPESV